MNPLANAYPNGHHAPVLPPESAATEPAGDSPSTSSQNSLNPESSLPGVHPPGRAAGTLNSAKRGPPILFDDEKRQQFCTLLRHGLPRAKAARLLGIAPRTVQKTVKKDPPFALRVRQARLDCQFRAAAQIARAGDSSWRAAAWVLEQEKRRRGLASPCSALRRLTDPRIRDELKKLVRGVLLEVMPELRKEITARRRSASPLEGAACDDVENQIKDRLVAMVVEARSLQQSGQSVDLNRLWHKHLSSIPRHKTGSNAPQFPPHHSQQPSQTDGDQNLAPIPPEPDPRIDAHFP
jgi:hypothetical protein